MTFSHPAEKLMLKRILKHLEELPVPEGTHPKTCGHCRFSLHGERFNPFRGCAHFRIYTTVKRTCAFYQRGSAQKADDPDVSGFSPDFNDDLFTSAKRHSKDCFEELSASISNALAESEEKEDLYWDCALECLDDQQLAVAVLRRLNPMEDGRILDLAPNWRRRFFLHFDRLAKRTIKNYPDIPNDLKEKVSANPFDLPMVAFRRGQQHNEAAAFNALIHDHVEIYRKSPILAVILRVRCVHDYNEIDPDARATEDILNVLIATDRFAAKIPRNLLEDVPKDEWRDMRHVLAEQLALGYRRIGSVGLSFKYYRRAITLAADADAKLENIYEGAALLAKSGRRSQAFQFLCNGMEILDRVEDKVEIAGWEIFYFTILFELGFELAYEDHVPRTDAGRHCKKVLVDIQTKDTERAVKEADPFISWLHDAIDQERVFLKEEISNKDNPEKQHYTFHELDPNDSYSQLIMDLVRNYKEPKQALPILEKLNTFPETKIAPNLLQQKLAYEAAVYFQDHRYELAHQHFESLFMSGYMDHPDSKLWFGYRFLSAVFNLVKVIRRPDPGRLKSIGRILTESREVIVNSFKSCRSFEELYTQRVMFQENLTMVLTGVEVLYQFMENQFVEEAVQSILANLWDLLVLAQSIGGRGEELVILDKRNTLEERDFQKALAVYLKKLAAIEADEEYLKAETVLIREKRENAVRDRIERSFEALKKSELQVRRLMILPQTVQYRRDQDIALLYFTSTDSSGKRWFITLSRYAGKVSLHPLGSIQQIERLIDQWIKTDFYFRKNEKFGKMLSKIFLKPLKIFRSRANEKPFLCLHLEPPLANMGWDLLPYLNGVLGTYFPVNMVLRSSASRKPIQLQKGVLMLTNPICPPAFDMGRLVSGEREADEAHDIFKQKEVPFSVLTGTRANIQTLTEKLTAQQPAVLHIGAHGYVDPSIPDAHTLFLSALEDDDESALLTYRKIAGLPLRNVELVILSACWSGAGKPKRGFGVDGLARAFLKAGVKQVLSSRWEAPDDEVTPAFMRIFYQHLMDQSAVQALWLTKSHFYRQITNGDDDENSISEWDIGTWVLYS